MSSQPIAIGTPIAAPRPFSTQFVAGSATPPSTIKELLDIVRLQGKKNIPMLRTTAARLSEYLGKPLVELDIEVLVDVREYFVHT